MEQPRRKKNRLLNYDYSQNGAYFITICTENRKCLLSTIVGAIIDRPAYSRLTAAGEKVEEAIRGIPVHYPNVHLEKYVIMPNHIHLLLMIDTLHGRSMIAPTISTVVRHMKGFATRSIGHRVFQKSFHDRIIRDGAEYDEIWQYIDTNPLRWELDCFYTEE
jgi:REP element-mobilizing transposase RayT